MRPFWLFALLALAVATEFVYRPILSLGVASIDFPLLVILWLAQKDRRARIHLAVLSVALFRAWTDENSLGPLWAPLALTAELMLAARTRLHLRSHLVRSIAIALLSTVAIAVEAWLSEFGFSILVARAALWGGVVASLSALLLFPILDSSKQLLRSALYPL